ncbi:MAG: sensor histidine kinase [Agathobacter sp.]|nr:sensor histidine kinase [Agathobacter sp.]
MILSASLVIDIALLAAKFFLTRYKVIAIRFLALAVIVNTIAYYMVSGLAASFGQNLLASAVCTLTAKIFVVWFFQQSGEQEIANAPVYLVTILLSLCLHANPISGIGTETVLLLFLLYVERVKPDPEEKAPAKKRESDIYLMTIEDSYRKNRALMHDLKNHMIALRSLAEKKEYDKLLQYTDTLTEKVSENLFPVHSGNLVLDALLADKYHTARRNKIYVEFVTVNYNIDLDSGDLCTVIGNLFDNAIAENLKTSLTDDRRISVLIHTAEEWLIVEIKNPLFHELNIKNGLPASDKPNLEHHGIGLKNVRRVCDKYGGELLWNDADGIFTVTARLKITSNL